MSIVYAYFFDQFVFHEKMNAIELSGALVILIVAIFISYYKLRQSQIDKKREEEGGAAAIADSNSDSNYIRK